MPATIITSAAGFSAAIMERLRADTLIVENAALEACTAGVRDLSRLTNDLGLVDQGAYKNAWGARRVPRGAAVENTAPHAPAIEYGRRPNRPGPPYDPILAWVLRKLVKNGRCTEAEAPGVALAIQRKIHYRGTKPHHVLGGYIPKLRARFGVAVMRELRRKRA